jgi:hypothetical protein
MALAMGEMEWLRDNMGKELTQIIDMPATRGMCLSDGWAVEEDGYLFATQKGQRLMAHYGVT